MTTPIEIERAWGKLHRVLGHTQHHCAYCGKLLPTQLAMFPYVATASSVGSGHHALIREGRGMTIPQKVALLDPHNVVLACPECHVPEQPGFLVKCCLYLLRKYGPEELESWVAGLPMDETSKTLPKYYWEAKEKWQESQTK